MDAVVHCLGPQGTFSHILALKRFGRGVPCRFQQTLEEVVEGMLADVGSAAILPIENSSGGTVADSIDILIRRVGEMHVTEEVSLDVRIALLGKPGAKPKVVYSHFTQIKHYGEWLRKKFPGLRLQPVESTATAARKASRSMSAAALAAPSAAEIYRLAALTRLPSRGEPNVTNFYILRTGPPPKKPVREANVQAKWKTALVAALPDVCGSLHAFLGPFAELGVNMTRIISRPVRGCPNRYVFFIEIEGDSHEGPAERAIEMASQLAENLSVLGTFPSGRHLQT